ncbi:hypothetical protein [Shimia ponticola]|uniref:hypothetical protein n=1 Tax=Shimia ponticola TaxID=2582893 RepID=UPI0011BF7197|nr:hypothetical protein [Shimia ponticola]
MTDATAYRLEGEDNTAVPFQRYFGTAIVLMIPLCLMHLLVPTTSETTIYDGFLNSLGQLYMTAVFLGLAFRIIFAFPGAIWTPMFWLPVQCGVFFGFGPLVEVFGNEYTRSYLSEYSLAIDSGQLTRANALSVVGTTFVMFGVFLHLGFARNMWTQALALRPSPTAQTNGLKAAALIFVLAGFYLKYVLVMPSQYGGQVVPGVMVKMTAMLDAGFAMMAYLIVARRDSLLTLMFLALFPAHLALSFVSFSKSAVVIALLLPALGVYLANAKLKQLLMSFLVIGLLYSTLQPYVHYGRAVIYNKTGTISLATYSERAQIAGQFFVNQATVATPPNIEERQSWWTRLSFVGQQAFAIELYDSGQRGDTINRVWMYFIPRAIWRDKPVLYAPGLEFYYLVTLRERVSFMPATVFGDLYWQYGWAGVVFGTTIIGMLFSFLGVLCVRVVRRKQLVMLPVLAIIVEMSANALVRFVINGIISPLPLLAFYFVAFSVLSRLRLK